MESEADSRQKSWKCPNCRFTKEEPPEHHDNACPNCNVERLYEMRTVECPDCDGTEWELIEPEDAFSGPDPTLRCVACHRTAQIDDSGAWW